MKKLLFLTLLFSLQGYSQKTLEIYNLTVHTVHITGIVTNASGAYPEFSASFGAPGMITLTPGASYTLQNTSSTTRFPFESPSSVPYIPSWYRNTSPTAVTLMPSPAAWVLGNPQVFDTLRFRVVDSSGNGSFGTVSTTSPAATGPGWDALYDMSSIPPAITYTVVIF